MDGVGLVDPALERGLVRDRVQGSAKVVVEERGQIAGAQLLLERAETGAAEASVGRWGRGTTWKPLSTDPKVDGFLDE